MVLCNKLHFPVQKRLVALDLLVLVRQQEVIGFCVIWYRVLVNLVS